MIRLLTIAVAVTTGLVASACHGQMSAADPSDATARKAMSFRALSALVGAQCSDPDKGKGCISGNPDNGDFQTVELKPGCGPTATFGRTVRVADVMDRTPPNDTVELAKLQHGLKVCIQAIAREGHADGYYYVTPGDCPATAGSSNKACVSGWVDARDVSIAPE